MIGNLIVRIQDWADVKLRRLCGRITPDMRVVVILVMFVFFGGLSIYLTVSAIYHIGQEDKALEIEHMKQLQLKNDTIINPFNPQRNHGRERFE